MSESSIDRLDTESLDAYLWRLGNLKVRNEVSLTWPALRDIMNAEAGVTHDESYWRKRHKKLSSLTTSQDIPVYADTSFNADIKRAAVVNETKKVLLREQRALFTKEIKNRARLIDLLDDIKNEVKKMSALSTNDYAPQVTVNNDSKAVYAMLSDIHYGLAFKNRYSEFNSDIAKQRVMTYAKEIADIGAVYDADDVYVSLMGDMISGNIHTSIRAENRENVIEQVIGAAELVAEFLAYLAKFYKRVYVNSVSGNHSRIEQNADAALRGEKLDAMIPWYCKARLENIPSIEFKDNEYDETFAVFDIFDKRYVAVHGDMDNDLRNSSLRLSQLMECDIDYLLAGHLHVADCRIENVGYIRNGAVVSGGDEYTAKKRLFGPASQVCMIVSNRGVESIHPVRLS